MGTTEQELISGHWLFERSDKTLSIPMRFEADGTIFPLWNDNEFGWRLDGSDVLILTRSGEVSTRFRPLREGIYEGPFLLPWWEEITHRLVATPPRPDMQTLITVGGGYRSLVVTLNSLKAPFNGVSTRWEMHNWVAGLEADSLRIAERGPDFTWYTDKTQRIRSLISFLAPNYDRVILVGMSSGAYASLLIGELIGRDLPSLQVYTFAINPQTVHRAEQRDFLIDRFDRFWRPQMIQGRCLAGADCPTTELPDLLDRKGLRNVHHTIYFDSKNVVEHYYVGLLKFAAIKFVPVDLGLSHADGVVAIYKKGLMQDDVCAVLDSDEAHMCVLSDES